MHVISCNFYLSIFLYSISLFLLIPALPTSVNSTLLYDIQFFKAFNSKNPVRKNLFYWNFLLFFLNLTLMLRIGYNIELQETFRIDIYSAVHLIQTLLVQKSC